MMPAFLLTAWPIIKRLLPYLGGLLLIAGAYWWADSRGREAQRAKDAKAIVAITQQRDTWIGAFHQSDANFHAMAGIANAESASIMSLKRDGEERARQAKANIAESLKRNSALTEQNKALIRSAGRHYSTTEPCASSGAYMTAKDM